MKPADLYVGVVDLFSILLPGSVSAWAVWRWMGAQDAELVRFLPAGEAAGWTAFLLSAFGAGHVIFLLASFTDATFDRFRRLVLRRIKGTSASEQDQLALEAANALREASLGLTSTPRTKSRAHAQRLAEARAWALATMHRAGAVSPSIPGPDATNTYQWSRAVLRLRVPQAYADVEKLQADSKFFRSLCVVFVAAALAALAGEAAWLRPGWVLVLAALCYWRYAELRDKAINEAYRAVVVLFTLPAPGRAG